MSTIKISNLYPAGADLLSDNESYLEEIGDTELQHVKGGFVVSQVTMSEGYLGVPQNNLNSFNNVNNDNYAAPGYYENDSFFLTSFGIKTYVVDYFV